MPTNNSTQSITLYFKEGNSDKIYSVARVPQGGGFMVNFAYGRRGSTMQTGTKTPGGPVPYEAAKKIYDKLVAEKTGKGYSPGEAGTPYQHTDQESRATGISPQLLNAIDEVAAERLIADPAWAMQEKFDGRRILIRRTGAQGGEVIGINRRALTIALPEPVAQCVRDLSGGEMILDGECIGDVYVTFDLLELGGTDLRSKPYSLRLAALGDLVGKAAVKSPVRLVKTVTGSAQKQAFLTELRGRKAEGAVFKRLDAPYSAGRPSGGGGSQVKLKFTATASCIVGRINAGKRSVSLELFDGKKRVSVGNLTIPPNQAIPSVGSIVETKYLYAHVGGALFQPVYLGKRDDISARACTVGQLKFKPPENQDTPEAGEEDSEN